MRKGTSLVEVLMSILVMGIGVLAVIVLFPAAYLRTLQATNLTNSTILRQNVESLIELEPVDRLTIYPYWKANQLYQPDDIVLPTVDPGPGNNRRYRLVNALPSTSGPTQPDWDTAVGGVVGDGGCTWVCEDHSHYVIDPLGWHIMDPAFRLNFGNNGVAGYPLNRYNAKTAGLMQAEYLTTSPDSWKPQLKATPTSITLTSVNFPASSDLSGISVSNPKSRVLLFKDVGRSETRYITSIVGQTVSWDSAALLPAGFSPIEVRIETQERRYTWLLTVRRSLNGVPSADVVVYFRRPFDPVDERVFNVASIVGRDVELTHSADGTKPPTKKGGFLLDVDNLIWYRVQNAVEIGPNVTRVTLDKKPFVAISNAVTPRNIVDVFPLGSKL